MKEIENLGTNKEVFFFDTYAMFEILEGNPKYEKYSHCGIITTIFNLAEFNYNLKKEIAKEKADELTEDYVGFLVDVEFGDLTKEMDLKTKHRNLSIPDAVGYIAAKKHNVKFLTGDEGFRDFDNVEFVKK
ncbi:MAG: PIN domain-containing protein [Nanoarchaeota archaeon]|nr:PIN domain-containing protein [Nanoarchaeota archaeon]MBU0978165.1 PIN domain-containing protein [Nanoarchaeota archaeon]